MTIGGGGVFIKYGYNIFSKIKPDSVDNINPLTRSNVEIGGRKNFFLLSCFVRNVREPISSLLSKVSKTKFALVNGQKCDEMHNT